MNENLVGSEIVDGAVKIHRDLGPGLLESVYSTVLSHELRGRGLRIERQVVVPIHYQGISIQEAFRADLIVENKVILELKSVEQLKRVHYKQLLTYLKLKDFKLGFILNFGAALMKEGIVRMVNNL